MNIAVILAGGVGNRFGAAIPKQFVEVLNKPILSYTVEVFERNNEIDAVLVVCVKSYIDYVWEMKSKYSFNKIKWVTEGGNSFQESVIRGLFFLEDKISRNDIVIVHFGASPFVTDEIVNDSIRVCKNKGNAISTTDFYLLPGKKNTEDSVSDPNNYSKEYINRDTIAVMNTPHAFQYGFVYDMYKDAISTGVIDQVEPHTTSLMYAMGKRIYFSYGSQSNIKITRKDDIELFEGYVIGQLRKPKKSIDGDVIVFMADGVEECESLLVVDLLRRAGMGVIMASIMGRIDVRSSRGIIIQTDSLAENVNYDAAKLIVLPGGRIGTRNLMNSDLVQEQCIRFANMNKCIAAVCAAPSILASFGLLNKRRATVHPDFCEMMGNAIITNDDVTIDGNIITGRGLGVTIPFSLAIIDELISVEESKRIAKAICYREN